MRFLPSGVVRKRSCGQPLASTAEKSQSYAMRESSHSSKYMGAELIRRATRRTGELWRAVRGRITKAGVDEPFRRPNSVTRIGYGCALPGASTTRYAGHVASSLTGPTPVCSPFPNNSLQSIHCRQYEILYVRHRSSDLSLQKTLACRPEPQQIVSSNNTCIVPASLLKCCTGCATVVLNLTVP